MKKFFKFFIIGVLALGVIGTFIFLWKKSQPKEVIYEIVEVNNGSIEKKTIATGKVEPRYEILIKPQLSGIISDIYKKAGDKVKEGDIIAKIKLIPDMVSLNNAEARVVRAQLVFDQTSSVFERDKKLYQEKVISKEDFEKSQLQYNNDKADLKAAQDNLSLTRDGITSDKTMLSNTLVRSTITGTILDIPVKVGNSVIQSNNFNDGTTIASVADMSDMLFVGKLDETEVGRVNQGAEMKISIGALQDVSLNAKLEYIAPKGVESGGAVLFDMKAAVHVPDDVFIRAGYSANAEIIFAKAENVIVIPESCLEFSKDTTFVHILKNTDPQEFEKKMVKTGLSDGVNIEITEGLKLEDKIRGSVVIEKSNIVVE
ncbi:MAG: efflux transporter periplasmic adaptor subunit [Bacteroidales bacterium 36-12]|nr:MAG: efflux transporter periplasmic adaptor subunit [Bacteroidales bacterium 36-12]